MKFLLLGVFMCFLGQLKAQEWIDLANVYWRTSPLSTFDNVSDYKRNLNMYVVDAKLPLVINEKQTFIIGLEYQYNSITSNTSLYRDYNFSSTMLQLGFEQKWNDKTKTLFMVIPRMQTDYQQVDISHFQLGGLVLGTTSRSENFDWKYGLYYNSEFFGHMFVPLFGFNWNIERFNMRLKLVVPLNLELSYLSSNKIRSGLKFEGVNASYMYQQLPGNAFSQNYLDKADNNIWAFAEFNLGGKFWIHFKMGHSVLRKYRFFQSGDQLTLKLGPINIGENRNYSNSDLVPIQLSDGWSFEARMIYRFPLD